MGYTAKGNATQAVDNLRMMWRHADQVIMCVKSQERDDEAELIERLQAVQDDIAGLIRDLRATK